MVVDSSLILCSHVRMRLESSSIEYVDLLKAALSLALNVLAYLNSLCSDNAETTNKKEKVTVCLGRLEEILHDWITDRKVIGGSMFGGSAYTQSGKAEVEIRVRSNMCTLLNFNLLYVLSFGTRYFNWNIHMTLRLPVGGRLSYESLSKVE